MIAIDPGKNGGIAWTDLDGTLNTIKMPDTIGSLVDKLREIRAAGSFEAVLEKVGGFIEGSQMPASKAFVFGENYGAVQAALSALGYRYTLIAPQKWQKPLSLGTKASAGGSHAWKVKLKAEAQRRFPSVEVTLWNADALLILDYALHERRGD